MVFGFLLALIALGTTTFSVLFFKDYAQNKNKGLEGEPKFNFGAAFGIGFIADFLNALAVGSFAVTTSLNSVFRQVSDKLLPGTMLVGISGWAEPFTTILPLIANIWPNSPLLTAEFTTQFTIGGTTLISFAIASAVGGIFGARLVSGWNEKTIQKVMGFGLLAVAIIMALKNIKPGGVSLWSSIFPGDSNTLVALDGVKLIVGILGAALFGAMQNCGIGFYAPIMALLNVLGMTSGAGLFSAFVGCAVGTNASTIAFIKSGKFNRPVAFAWLIAGGISTIVAIYLVGSMPGYVLSIIVNFVLVYAAAMMLKKGFKKA